MALYLLIDTSNKDYLYLATFDSSGKTASKNISIGYKYSEKIVVEVDGFLVESGNNLDDLTGIIAVEGPGRFSAIRSGVSVANALAWSLDVPVLPISSENRDESALKAVRNNRKRKFSRAILPVYDQEPNISKPNNK